MKNLLEIAWTSFTDSFISRLSRYNVTTKDTPEAVASKLNGILNSLKPYTQMWVEMIWEDVLNKIYPWMLSKSTWNSFIKDFSWAGWNVNNMFTWIKFNY